jgi:hypothetical protein
MMALAEGHHQFVLGKRRFNEDTNTPTQDICKRFRPMSILNAHWPPATEPFEGTNCGAKPHKLPVSNDQWSKTVLSTDEDTLIANYILLLEKVNKLESSNTSLENIINKLRKDTNILEDKYKEQSQTLKKYVDKSAEIYKLASESKDLIIKMELLTDKCKAVLAENEVLKTDIKYLEKACDKSADYYRTCFT